MSNEGFGLQQVQGQDREVPMRRGYPGSFIPAERYVDGYGYGPDREPDYEAQEGGDATRILREILNSARKHKWFIIVITILVPPLVFIEASRFRPTYTAFSDIEIRRDGSGLPTPSTEDPANMVIINTKKLMFDSRPLLQSVIEEYRLNEDPRFVDVSPKRSRMDTLKSLFRRDNPASAEESKSDESSANQPAQPAGVAEAQPDRKPLSEKALDRYIGIIKNGKRVDQIRDTQALRISFTHTNADIARMVANGLTDRFIQSNLDSKLDTFRGTSQWLDKVTTQLAAQVQQAELELNRFTREKGIFSFDESGQETLAATKLKRLQDQIGEVERDLMTKELIANEIEHNRTAQLSQIISDPRIAKFQATLDELLREETKLSQDFGDEHPNMKNIRQQIAQVRSQLESSTREAEIRLKSDYARSKSERDQLQAQLEKTRSEAVEKDQAAISYSLLKQKLDNTKAVYLDFLQKKQQTGLEAAQQRSNISVLRPAELPKSQDGVNPIFMTLLGLGAAFMGSIGLGFLYDKLDTTVKSAGDVSRYTQLPTLGLIPSIGEGAKKHLFLGRKKKAERNISISSDSSRGKDAQSAGFSHRFRRSLGPAKSSGASYSSGSQESDSDRVILVDDLSPVAEAYRVLRTSVLLSTGGSPPKTMLFTSGQPGEGKTTTVINTAISLAHLGASVLIIDADLRKPATHKGFNLKQSHGLSTYLSRDAALEGLIQKLPIPNLSLLPCGPILPNPAELISSEKMKDMLKVLAGKYDHILIDSPPLTYVTDPVILSTLVDGVVLVVHGGKSRREIVRLSRQMLDNVGARVFGVVLNNIRPNSLSSDELGYFKYYSYYSEQERSEERVSEILR